MSHHLLLALGVLLGFLLGGRHATQAARFTFTPLDVPFADTLSTEAFDINGRGQIVGIYSDSLGEHRFLAEAGVLTPPDVPGAHDTQAFVINGRDQIVGTFDDSTARDLAFL